MKSEQKLTALFGGRKSNHLFGILTHLPVRTRHYAKFARTSPPTKNSQLTDTQVRMLTNHSFCVRSEKSAEFHRKDINFVESCLHTRILRIQTCANRLKQEPLSELQACSSWQLSLYSALHLPLHLSLPL